MDEKLGDMAKNTSHRLITHKSLISEIPNSLWIHSDLSEPADIKTWFSSYAYETPALDSEEKEIEKVVVDSEDLNPLDTEEIPRSSCLLAKPSDLSEPPDITNWFSSYVYESPVLDTEEESQLSVFGKDEIKKVIDSEKQNQIGAEDNCLVKKYSATKISDDDSHELKLKESKEDNIDSWQNGGNHVKKIDSSVSSPKGLLEKDYYGSAESKYRRKEPADVSLADSQRTPLKNSVLRSIGEETKVNEPSTNGFISTRKNKYINENALGSSNSSQRTHTNPVRKPVLNFPLTETHVGVGRRPLLERTNLQYEVERPETTGKWRCPERSKPDLGPPLKQLRLEKWVRRVQ